MNIIPFESQSRLPAYLQSPAGPVNDDLTAHAGGGFALLSIKGKQWTVVRGGDRTTLMNPKDPESPAAKLDLVLIKVNKETSKTYYAKAYDPKQGDDVKPTCYSNDGVSPAVDSEQVQSAKCATCRHNQWGSRISTDRGASKGKACQDNVRAAVAPAGQLNDPMLLRIPPTSIANLGEFGAKLAKRGVPYQAVVTKVGFDPEAESPKLTFEPVGFLDEQAFAEIKQMAESPVVLSILGKGPGAAPEVAPAGVPAEAAADKVPSQTKTKDVSEQEVRVAVETAVAKPATAKAVKKVGGEPVADLEIEIDGLNFDD